MDGKHFDRLTRTLATEQTRRGALKSLLGLAVGIGGVAITDRQADSARRGYSGPLDECRSDEIKCNGTCYPASTTVCCSEAPCPIGMCAPTGECCASGATICSGACCAGPCLDGVCCSPDVGYSCSPGDGSTYCAALGACCTAADCAPANAACQQAACIDGGCTVIAGNDGAPCDDGNLCTGSGSCSGGVCQAGSPIQCTANPGECQAGGSCNSATGLCEFDTAPNGAVCGADRTCCGGSCCLPQSECIGGACQSTCVGLGEFCADETECCQDSGITGCEEVCCLANEEACGSGGDCCSGRCNGEYCCSGPNSPCSHEGECCGGELGSCDSGVCRCRRQGETCDSSFECCGFDICQGGVCIAGTCIDPGGACRSDFECCANGGTAYCEQPDFRCCRYTGGTCDTHDECCGGDICANRTCCGPKDVACTVDDDCCSGTCCDGVCCDSLLSCINEICRETCPIGGFPCGATECCGSHEHCIDGGCMCLPLRSECDPNNNLCCQNGDTMCFPIGTVGMEFEHCCQGVGSPCNRANDGTTLRSDCCSLSAQFTGAWRGACGFDGVCGGRGGVCFTHAECVSGHCEGHCGNQFPVKPCLQDAECDCDGDIEDGCVERHGRCIDTYCE